MPGCGENGSGDAYRASDPGDSGLSGPVMQFEGWLCRCSHSASVRLIPCMGTVDQGWWVRSLSAAAGISCVALLAGLCGSTSVCGGGVVKHQANCPWRSSAQAQIPSLLHMRLPEKEISDVVVCCCVCQTCLASHKSTRRLVQIGSLRFSEMHATL